MSPAEREALLAIHTRLMKATLVLNDIAERDDTKRGAMYRLCAELLSEQCIWMDGMLHPKGGAA